MGLTLCSADRYALDLVNAAVLGIDRPASSLSGRRLNAASALLLLTKSSCSAIRMP